jgi:putative transposase
MRLIHVMAKALRPSRDTTASERSRPARSRNGGRVVRPQVTDAARFSTNLLCALAETQPAVSRAPQYSTNEILTILRELAHGVSVGELCRRYRVSDSSIYRWRRRYGAYIAEQALTVELSRRLARVEAETRRLRQLLDSASVETTPALFAR